MTKGCATTFFVFGAQSEAPLALLAASEVHQHTHQGSGAQILFLQRPSLGAMVPKVDSKVLRRMTEAPRCQGEGEKITDDRIEVLSHCRTG